MCARTSVYTRFHPRVLHTLHSLFRLSLPSIRPPPLRVSPFDRLGPSRALSLRPLAPYFFVRYHLSRARLFRSPAKSSLFFEHLYRNHGPPSSLLRKPVSFLSLPPPSFYRSLPHALTTLSSPYLSRARDRPILSSLRALVYNVAASGAAAPSRPAQGRTQPVRATSRIRRVLRDLQRLRSRGY